MVLPKKAFYSTSQTILRSPSEPRHSSICTLVLTGLSVSLEPGTIVSGYFFVRGTSFSSKLSGSGRILSTCLDLRFFQIVLVPPQILLIRSLLCACLYRVLFILCTCLDRALVPGLALSCLDRGANMDPFLRAMFPVQSTGGMDSAYASKLSILG